MPAPQVHITRARWVREIDKLMAVEGADLPLLRTVRTWIEEGVKSVFPNGPPPREKHTNTHTFTANEEVCKERLAVYRDMGALRKLAGAPPAGAHVQPLHAVIKEGKSARVCVDLSRNFNDFIPDQTFGMATLQDAVELSMEAGRRAWYVKLDISACFLSFPIHPDDLQYFYCQAGGDFYQFLTLVFGRKDTPLVASILLDVVSTSITELRRCLT